MRPSHEQGVAGGEVTEADEPPLADHSGQLVVVPIGDAVALVLDAHGGRPAAVVDRRMVTAGLVIGAGPEELAEGDREPAQVSSGL